MALWRVMWSDHCPLIGCKWRRRSAGLLFSTFHIWAFCSVWKMEWLDYQPEPESSSSVWAQLRAGRDTNGARRGNIHQGWKIKSSEQVRPRNFRHPRINLATREGVKMSAQKCVISARCFLQVSRAPKKQNCWSNVLFLRSEIFQMPKAHWQLDKQIKY